MYKNKIIVKNKKPILNLKSGAMKNQNKHPANNTLPIQKTSRRNDIFRLKTRKVKEERTLNK